MQKKKPWTGWSSQESETGIRSGYCGRVELPLARKVSDYVLCVKGDRIVATGTAEEIFTPMVIDELYDLEPGVFDPITGAIRLEGEC